MQETGAGAYVDADRKIALERVTEWEDVIQ
jgi:hypothetical protein